MMSKILAGLLFAFTLTGCMAQVTPAKLSASIAVPKTDEAAVKKHERILQRGKSGPINLIFLGDSITERWETAPHIWDAYFGKYQPANFGIGGDRTQHIIWRIENGALDGLAPKVLVFMAGTNNSLDYNAEEILAAHTKIVSIIRAKLPQTKILLLGVLPRGVHEFVRPGTTITEEQKIVSHGKRMQTISDLNKNMAKLDDGKTIRFLDIGARFLGQDGKPPLSIMPDQLHLSPAGYQLWADAMKPLLDSMMSQ
ncbi:MAG: GDSL-type esterase/lipase family protein [Pseudomonadota bacterium]